MLKVERHGPVLTLSLNRPEVRNAFDEHLISTLDGALQEVPREVRVVVLTGEGSAFCAGGDLNWMRRAAGFSHAENLEDAHRLSRLLARIQDLEAAVVVRVNGACFGGGCGLVAAADVVVASDTAQFAFSEVRLGLVPAVISPFVLAKVARTHARALFMTGEAFGAERAKEIGLVHEVVPDEGLDSAVARTVDRLLQNGPEAVLACKRLARSEPLSAEESAELLAERRASSEGKEGIAAFLEKRPPSYRVDRDSST